MQNPDFVSDPTGEWFEIHNPTSTRLELMGCVLTDDDGRDNHTITSSLVVAPGGYVSLARSATPGFTADYVYSGFVLGNTEDQINFTCGGTLIDRVSYDGGPVFPDPTGVSMQLNPTALDAISNDAGANWCESSAASYDGGDNSGTPGAPNPGC